MAPEFADREPAGAQLAPGDPASGGPEPVDPAPGGPVSAGAEPGDPPPETRRPGGRPRGPATATQSAVLAAAWRILTDEGITALTPTRLHAETGVARTTIYRHWPDASAVVADIVAGASKRRVPAEPTGDLRTDLLAALETLTFRLRHRPVGPLLGALLAGEARTGARGPTSAAYVGALIAPIRDVIVAGVERGTLLAPVGADADSLLHELVGPMLLDVVLLGGDPHRIDDPAVVDVFLDRHRAPDAASVPSERPDAEVGEPGGSGEISG